VRALVVHCHPNAASFTAAVRDRVVAALSARGDEVRVTDLYADGFNPVMSATERQRHLEPGPDPSVADHAADLQWCQHLVLVYPTWWSGQPAMLKGWIDRVWVRDVAFDLPSESSRVHARLRNVRRITVVTTHGSSKFVNAIEGEAGKRMVTRTLRAVCHPLARTRWVALYGVDTATEQQRVAFLDRAAKKVARR
jgi:putative NADPH-quinone reductase